MNILLVDDDELDRLAIRRALRSSDISGIEDAASAVEALAAMSERDFDCVLLDDNLPGSDGFDVMRNMRQRDIRMPVVVLTGHADEEVAVELMKSGASDYLSKNALSPARLVQSLRYAAERRRLEEERDQLLRREKEAREQAESANLAKDHFLAIVSHDLRTPLNAIYGWVRILLTQEIDAATRMHGLEVIERNVRAQIQLIADLLDVSRILSGKLRLEARSIDPARVCEDAVEAVRVAAQGKGVRIEQELDQRAGAIVADPGRLQQVVWNLLSNAVKFTPAGGTVRISLRRRESGVEVVVSDTGQGIASDFLPHIFERFSQGIHGEKGAVDGLGLGLAIVRSIVELHGGSVRAESAGEGRGASFLVYLPWTPEASAEPVGADIPRPPSPAALQDVLQGVRVLFVDDSADARELVSAILTRYGAAVRTCESTDEALAALPREQPDVVISDIEMPGGTGYELIRALRVREEPGSRIPAIALTGYTRPEDRIRILAAGFQLHVPKPVEPLELVTVVASLVGRKVGDTPA